MIGGRVALLVWVSGFSLGQEDGGVRELREFPRPTGAGQVEGPRFQELAPGESGLDFTIPIDNDHPDRRLYFSAMACGSVAAGDLDGDGWPDLFFAAGPVSNRLYRNGGGDLRFEEVPGAAGMADADSWCASVAMVDIDNDGDLDLYVCRYDAPNRLWLNESRPGEFRFREEAADFGLDLVDASLMAAFADYDRDGDLDVFLVANAYYRKGGRPAEGVPMRKTATGWEVVTPYDRYFAISSIDPGTGEPRYDECGRPNRLLRNEGGRFVEVSALAGLRSDPTHTNAAVWWDFDGDGWLDLYVANDFSATDACYRNRGDGSFVEMAGDLFQHSSWFSMGAAAEDFNGDGRTDLVVADMAPTTHYRQKVTMGEMGASFDAMYAAGLPRQNMVNTFFVNTGGGLFFEAARQAGIAQTDWTWTVKSGDLDNDGRLDLYFTTGHSRDFNHSDLKTATPAQRIGREDWEFFIDAPELRERDLVYRNARDWRFERSTEAWGLGMRETMTYGGALSDLDRDGDLDLVVTRLEEPPGLYRNLTADRGEGGGLLVSLKGSRSNRFGIGARLTLETSDGARQTRTLAPTNGYLESDEPVVHFGLGAADRAVRLSIDWPGGARQVLRDLMGGRWLEVSERDDTGEKLEDGRGKLAGAWFESGPVFTELTAVEERFDDYHRQPLLPHQHSQLGPGLAWGDVDGDGRGDLYLGGPKGHPGRLLLHRGDDGRGHPVFAFRMREPFTSMLGYEDLGVVFFDADGDGDQDLLVVSGSVECEPGAPELADRLYLNDGGGEFVAASDRLPDPGEAGHASGSVAVVADFDRDGDLDVFIGGRVVPGAYPLAARNRLLVNDGAGSFTDQAEAFGLGETGMVTAALWSDVDGDGWIDLLVAHEWGAIRTFRNREGILGEAEDTGLEGATGFWNSLAGRDLDGDGDMDYLAGNLGHNTKYHATPEAPEIIYYGAFDESGKKNLIEAKIDKTRDCLLPRRGLSCSSRAMPTLLEKVNTYHGWASSSLEQLYSDTYLSRALRLEVTTLDSVRLINDGEGRFELRPLPAMAQLAPVFGIALTDVNGDGYPDAVLAQNFLTPQEETGPYDGGLSLMLEGAAGGAFIERWPLESGIAVPGDAMSLAVGDLDGDDRPDLVFGVNQEAPRLFLNRGQREGRGEPLAIALTGSTGNPTAIGAKITVEIEGLPLQSAEITAGSGYLSQSESRLYFGWGTSANETVAKVSVRWSDGKITSHSLARKDGSGYRISNH